VISACLFLLAVQKGAPTIISLFLKHALCRTVLQLFCNRREGLIQNKMTIFEQRWIRENVEIVALYLRKFQNISYLSPINRFFLNFEKCLF
jgi:hypothetical protein